MGEEFKAACSDWLANQDNGTGTRERADRLIAAPEQVKGDDTFFNDIYANRDFLVKRSQWLFSGDGWAYDIGFGGLDHVLASGEDVNVLVFDTEVYSNTGGQSSKSTPSVAIAKFAASGKKAKKKDLGMMAMSYGYVYVAQITMGADKNQTLKVLLLRPRPIRSSSRSITAPSRYLSRKGHPLRLGSRTGRDNFSSSGSSIIWSNY